MEIERNETEIISQWIFDGHKMVRDENGKRINWLIHSYLKKVANDSSGWITFTRIQEIKDIGN